ncbi:hypothetical protein H4R19_003802 [Coemansia spiralis]|nr:hypothetical protein H4R19_003802 [Coemansia spiralis]
MQRARIGARLLTTSRVAAERHVGADRTQSTAFKKKYDDSKAKVKTGKTTSVNMSSANPLYYAGRPSPRLEMLGAQTAVPAHVNRVVGVDDGFMACLGPERFPGFLNVDFGLFGRPALLYRSQTQQLVDQLAQHAEAAPKRASVLDGRCGTGKSAELLKLASVAASQGHIVVYVPSTVRWVNSSQPYGPEPGGSGQFVQLELAVELLRTMGGMCRAALVRVPLGRSAPLGKRTFSAENTLADVVDAGLQTPGLAHGALDLLLDVASTQTSMPVLVAVDEVNALWCETQYRDQDDTVLPAHRLRLISALLPFFEGTKTLARGWVLGATSHTDVRFMPKDLKLRLDPPLATPVANPDLAKDPRNGSPPANLPFDTIRVDRFSPAEAWALMRFYHTTSIIASPVTEALVAKKWMVSSGNPREMFSSLTSFT